MTQQKRRHHARGFAALALLAGLAAALATCSPHPDLRQQVRTLGTLRVAMINSATGYYLRTDGPAGFEYDLTRRFAREFKLKMEVLPVANQHAAITAVESGQAHMAAGLAINHQRGQNVRFTQPYSQVALDVVYNSDSEKPDDPNAISGRLTIAAHGVLASRLRQRYPRLAFDVDNDASPETLMAAVAHGRLYSTIANDNVVAMNQRYYPNLRVAFPLPDIRRNLGWAFPVTGNSALYNQAIAWLEHAREAGVIDILYKRYFDHADRLGFVGGGIFAEQIKQRLTQWRAIFKRVAKQYRLDWRLLAAMSYQESHWDADAVSPTGVRGLMMLTEATATELGVGNREDPEQSIEGGARYLLQQRQRLPESVKEPDRTWLALAAYNIGFGHLMDARRLLVARGKNPNLWANVKKALTWLTEDKYTGETKYGYAPGHQAVEYVGNIRAYYDILVWKTRKKKDKSAQPAPVPHPATRQNEMGIMIDSPAL